MSNPGKVALSQKAQTIDPGHFDPTSVVNRTSNCFLRCVAKIAKWIWRIISWPFMKCIRIFMSAFLCVKNILFPKTQATKPLSDADKSKAALDSWLEKMVPKLSEEAKALLDKEIESGVSQEEKDLIVKQVVNKIPLQLKENSPTDCYNLDTFNALLTAACKNRKSELSKMSDLQKVRHRQIIEQKVLQDLSEAMTLIDSERFGSRETFISQMKFVEQRLEECNVSERNKDVLNQLKEELDPKGSNDLILQERILLLEQYLQMEADLTMREQLHQQDIAECNDNTHKAMLELHKTIETRWKASSGPISLPPLGEGWIKLIEEGKYREYFQAAMSLMKSLHEQEEKLIQKKMPEHYFANTNSDAFAQLERVLLPTINTQKRKALLSIKPASFYQEQRQNKMAECYLEFSLRKTADGLHLMACCNKEAVSLEDQAILKAAVAAKNQLFDKNKETLLNHLATTEEYKSDYLIPDNADPSNAVQRPDMQKRVDGLNGQLDLNLDDWFKELQKIWAQHLSVTERNHLQSLKTTERYNAMHRLFSAWVLGKTGFSLTRTLSFQNIKLPVEKEKEKKALQTIKKSFPLFKNYLDDVRERIKSKSDTTNTPSSFKGVSLENVSLENVSSKNLKFSFTRPSEDISQLTHEAPINFVAQAKEDLRKQQNEIGWVINASRSEIYRNLNDGYFIVYAAFQNLVKTLQASNAGLTEAFLDFILQESSPMLLKGNLWREGALRCYLSMLFAGSDQDKIYTVTEDQRRYLIQFATLAKYNLPHLNIGNSTFNDVGIERLGKALQATEIGLEGLDESTVQLSLQTLEGSSIDRPTIDFLRMRHEDALYLYEHIPLKKFQHDQHYAAIIRSAVSLYKPDLKGKYSTWLNDLFNRFSSQTLVIDEQTMAVSESIFWLDLFFAIDSNNWGENHLNTLNAFDDELIKSNNAPKMLVGLARKIYRLSVIFKNKQSTDRTVAEFCELLQLKMAYQRIKKDHYKNVQLDGFLKLFTDQAECAMADASDVIIDFANGNQWISVLNENTTGIFEQSIFVKTREIFKKINDITQNSIFCSFGAYDVDLVSGRVYIQGKQPISLPPFFQNHPHLHILGLDNLPYMPNPDGSFSYFTKEGDKEIQQVTLQKKQKVHPNEGPQNNDHDLIIVRRLPVDFKASMHESLTYVPLENISSMPAVIAERMGASNFWIKGNRVYGYSDQGDLKFFFDLNGDSIEKVTTPEGEFLLFKTSEDKKTPSYKIEDFLTHFIANDEILINKDRTLIYIPAIDLTLSWDNKQWNCKGPSIADMVLDLDAPIQNSILTLKQKSPKASVKVLNHQISGLEKELQALNKISGRSFIQNARVTELQKQIEHLRKKAALKDPRLYIALDNAYSGTDLRKTLVNAAKEWCNAGFRISAKEKPTNCLSLKDIYFEKKQAFLTCYAQYSEYCAKGARAFILETLVDNNVTARDLNGLLFLLEQEAAKKEIENLLWIHEFAKHPFNQPLTQQTVDFMGKVVEQISEKAPNLALYLKLLVCQNTFFNVQEKRAEYEAQQKAIKEFIEGSSIKCWALPSEVKALLHVHFPEVLENEAVIDLNDDEIIPFNSKELENLRALSQESLSEKLGLEKDIIADKKDSKKEISENQLKLIKSFQNHSKDQVEGFYLEEFGLFSQDTFIKEFESLGLDEWIVKRIFEKLGSEKWISQPFSDEIRYSVTNGLVMPSQQELLAILNQINPSLPNQEKIVNVLRNFLFKAAQSGFSCRWKDETSSAYGIRKLKEKHKEHHDLMLEAKHSLDAFLEKNNLTLVEFKRQVLMNDGSAFFINDEVMISPLFSAARHALLRYLLHKTEMKHIENILKAPLQGERNQVELLKLARQYPIDGLLDNKILDEEGIMQLAFLLFEEDYGARCNGMQIKLFRSLMLNSNHPEAVDAIQARMGFGKTALLPLMALVQLAMEASLDKEEKSLIRYVVPKAVLQDNATAFEERISHILGSNLLKDREFSRYQIDDKDPMESYKQIKADLKQRLAFYEHVRNEGLVLIQWPEIRQSMEAQEAALGFLLTKEGKTWTNEEERKACEECKQLLGQIRSITTYTIFDELDATQDFKSCEVNFTEGDKIPIDQNEITPLVTLIEYLKRNSPKDYSDMAKGMLSCLKIQNNSNDLIKYLTTRTQTKNDELNQFINGLSEEEQAGIYLIRALLLDQNIMDLATSKQPNTHFGVRFTQQNGKKIYFEDPETNSPLLIAVPYDGANTPKGLSIFDNTEVAAITTLRYYASTETEFDKDLHLRFLINQVQHIPQFIKDKMKNIQSSGHDKKDHFLKRLEDLARLLDAVEIAKEKESFYKDFLAQPSSKTRECFGMAVVALQVRSDEARANSNRYEMGSPLDKIKGCSGTVSSTSSYFERPANDPAADGKMSLEIMGRKNNADVAILPSFEDKKDYLDAVLGALLENAKPETRAIVDAAGICKSRDGTPETIVAALWNKLQQSTLIQGIEGIVYYGKDNVKRLYTGEGRVATRCTTQMELEAISSGKKYFSFYGQKNTRGSDIKQADGAHALVTMDENVPNNDAKQAVLRFRSLVQRSSGQTFTFALTERFADQLKAQKNGEIDAKDVIKDLRRKERAQEEHDALILFKKELTAHVTQAAFYVEHQLYSLEKLEGEQYQEFLKARNAIIPFVERSLQALEDKYGHALTEMEKNAFINQQLKIWNYKIEELERLSERFNDNQAINLVFFKKRIEVSKNLFESRYQKKKVEIARIDSGAQAIAMAMAEAQAEAQAEAVAEAIAESEVEVIDRLPTYRADMTTRKHFEIDSNWIDNPIGVAIEKDDYRKHLIHPRYHNQITISPHLQNDPLIAHYALLYNDNNNTEKGMFISYEEANRLKQTNYRMGVVDLRCLTDKQRENLLLVQMESAVLHSTMDVSKISMTKDFDNLNLPNIENASFLPTLNVNENINNYIDLTTFGITRSDEAQIAFAVDVDKVEIRADANLVEIPRQNEFLNKVIGFVYQNTTPNKLDQMDQAIKEREQHLQQERQRLQRLIDNLKARQDEALNQINNVQSFALNNNMKTGLLNRDNQCSDPWGGGLSSTNPNIFRAGERFIAEVDQIGNLQLRIQKASSYEDKRPLLTQLNNQFENFASNEVRCFQGNVNNDFIINKEQYNIECNNHRTCHVFDLVYGRILYHVHQGNLNNNERSAVKCTVDDCQNMFNVTLPALLSSVQSITAAIRALHPIDQEIEITNTEIAILDRAIKMVEEARQCIDSMKNSNIAGYFGDKGILLEENKDLFWDRMRLQNLNSWTDNTFNMNGRLPYYVREVFPVIEEYKKRMKCLSEKEKANFTIYENLKTSALKLSCQIEERQFTQQL